jgi:hypothetical protein
LAELKREACDYWIPALAARFARKTLGRNDKPIGRQE